MEGALPCRAGRRDVGRNRRCSLVAWRALSGEFPIKFGNVEYAIKDVTSEAEEASGSQEYRLRLLEVLAELRNPATLEDDGPRV